MSDEEFQAWELEHTMERIADNLRAVRRALTLVVALLAMILVAIIIQTAREGRTTHTTDATDVECYMHAVGKLECR